MPGRQMKKKNLIFNFFNNIFKKSKDAEHRLESVVKNVPKITNNTIVDVRESILKDARKYIYPLKHPKHYIVRFSIFLVSLGLVFFIAFSVVEIYVFQSSSDFIYGVSDIIPFPVAYSGTNYVTYRSYLFELRRNMHYFETQQQINFSQSINKNLLNHLKTESMNQVVLNYYVKKLAKKYNVSVSSKEVNSEISYFQNQNRLGSNLSVLQNVLDNFWGWSLSDFKSELSNELLQQKVVYKLDTQTVSTANAVYKQLINGSDFATLANQYSQDQNTKTNGGEYQGQILQSDRNLPPQVMAELFRLKVNEVSPIINTGYTLEILKVDSISGPAITASHIQFNLKSINNYIYLVSANKKIRYLINY